MSPRRIESAGKPATRHWPVNRPCPALAGDAEPRLQPRARGRGPSLLAVGTVLLLAARVLPAQAIGQGFELERARQYEQAAAIHLGVARARARAAAARSPGRAAAGGSAGGGRESDQRGAAGSAASHVRGP